MNLTLASRRAGGMEGQGVVGMEEEVIWNGWTRASDATITFRCRGD